MLLLAWVTIVLFCAWFYVYSVNRQMWWFGDWYDLMLDCLLGVLLGVLIATKTLLAFGVV